MQSEYSKRIFFFENYKIEEYIKAVLWSKILNNKQK